MIADDAHDGRNDRRGGEGGAGGRGRDDRTGGRRSRGDGAAPRSGGGYRHGGRDDRPRDGQGGRRAGEGRSGGPRYGARRPDASGPDGRRSGFEDRAGRRGDGYGGGRDRRDGQGRGDRAGRRPGPADSRFGPRGGDGPVRGRPRREDEPALPDTVSADELDKAVRRDLQTLDRQNADVVARHLVMAGTLVDSDPQAALRHARAARERAGRIAAVREAVGISAYHAGEWAEALSELRAARRMGGGPGLVSVMADCERGLGRPERALELARSEEARSLTGDAAIELRIVVSGARMDMGRYDAAVVTLQGGDLDPAKSGPAHVRLFYAYAEALLAAGRRAEALEWFLNCAAADEEGETDAEERVAELTGGAPGAGE